MKTIFAYCTFIPSETVLSNNFSSNHFVAVLFKHYIIAKKDNSFGFLSPFSLTEIKFAGKVKCILLQILLSLVS